ncbi:hypothetical protein HET69_42375, partial [Streptomyces sp. CJ_13]|nr:hypothetical protein [Streptomyces sp. CJ_13]
PDRRQRQLCIRDSSPGVAAPGSASVTAPASAPEPAPEPAGSPAESFPPGSPAVSVPAAGTSGVVDDTFGPGPAGVSSSPEPTASATTVPSAATVSAPAAASSTVRFREPATGRATGGASAGAGDGFSDIGKGSANTSARFAGASRRAGTTAVTASEALGPTGAAKATGTVGPAAATGTVAPNGPGAATATAPPTGGANRSGGDTAAAPAASRSVT